MVNPRVALRAQVLMSIISLMVITILILQMKGLRVPARVPARAPARVPARAPPRVLASPRAALKIIMRWLQQTQNTRI